MCHSDVVVCNKQHGLALGPTKHHKIGVTDYEPGHECCQSAVYLTVHRTMMFNTHDVDATKSQDRKSN